MNENYHKVADAINYIQLNYQSQPSLDNIASHVGLSPYHFQRIFSRYVGVSPKRFLENLTVNKAKTLLRDSVSVLETADAVGLSSSSRLYDHFITIEAMTPGEYKNAGQDLNIEYGIHLTPFGEVLLAQTDKGICWLSFISDLDTETALTEMREQWSLSKLVNAQTATGKTVKKVFSNKQAEFPLLVKGTNFQINVWRALLNIPSGHVISYKAVAEYINKPAAIRAAASAIGANSIAYLIPCHRVLRESGELGGYRWGLDKKMALIAVEVARKEKRITA